MPLVAVHGSYFVNNFGDTLLIKLLCDRIAAIIGRENVWLATEGHGKEQGSIGYPVLAKSERGRADVLVFSGGGYFGEPNTTLLRRYRWSKKAFARHLSWLADYDQARIAVLGVGVGPLTLPMIRWPVRRLFAAADAVLVRDQESFDFVQSYSFATERVAQCVDLALSLPAAQAAGRSGVALHLPDVEQGQVHMIMTALKASGAVGGAPVTVIYDGPVNPDFVDAGAIEATAREVFGEGVAVRPYDDVEGLVARLGGYELVVTSKLHVGIVTIARGGRVISTPHHVKTPRLYRQLGLSEFCVPTWEMSEDALLAAVAALPSFGLAPGVVEEGISIIDHTLERVLGAVRASEAPVFEIA